MSLSEINHLTNTVLHLDAIFENLEAVDGLYRALETPRGYKNLTDDSFWSLKELNKIYLIWEFGISVYYQVSAAKAKAMEIYRL